MCSPSNATGRRGLRAAVLLPAALLAAACAPAYVATPATSPPPAAPAALTVSALVDSITASPPLHRSHWGVAIHDATRGRTVLEHQSERHFVPASNTKLVVAAVALAELGPDYRYRTSVLHDALARRLTIVASGDPTMSERFNPTELAVLDSLADSVRIAGVQSLDEVVVDATRFDSIIRHPSWELGDLDWYYAAPVTPFAVAEAAIPIVTRAAAAVGLPAYFEVLYPAGVVPIRTDLITDTAGADLELNASRDPRTDSLYVNGAIALDAEPDTSWLAAPEPALYAARALITALRARGIEVRGGARVVYDSASAAPLRAQGRAVATWTSPPMTDIVRGILQPSQNWIAEVVLKTLGVERDSAGSWERGIDVEERWLYDVVGLDSGAVWLNDASGLSAQNLLTPNAIVQLLEHARAQPWGPAYRAALAVPGEPGTLRRRLQTLAGRIQAKTGSITHVNTLAGYLTTDDGRELSFAIMTNASGAPSSQIRAAIDRIVEVMATGRTR